MSSLRLRIQTSATQFRDIPLDHRSTIPAEHGATYALVDQSSGKVVTALVLKKKGDALVVEQGGETVAEIQGFYAAGQQAAFTVGTGEGSGSPTQITSNTLPAGGGEVVWQSSAANVAASSEGGGMSGLLTWPVIGGAAGAGALAVALGGGGGDSGGSGTTSSIVSGKIVAGPAIAGNGLSVEVYQADGTTKIGVATVKPDGSFSIDVGNYTGVIIAKVVDASSGPDYLDESTGQPKDLNAELISIGVVTSGNSTVTMNINPLTTVAYHKAVETAAGRPLDAATVTNTNSAVAQAFGLGDLLTTPVVTTNGQTSYNADDGLSAGEKYGALLAALSGADHNNQGDSQATINNLVNGITVSGGTATLSQGVQAEILSGGLTARVDGTAQGQLASTVAPLPITIGVAITSATGSQNNILNAGDVVSVTVTMSKATSVTGTPQLALNIGGSAVQASYVSGSGTSALVFQYTITNESDANGISIDANSLSLNGGTLKDSAGNNATLTHRVVADNGDFMVDTSLPTGTINASWAAVQLEAIGNTSGYDTNPQILALGDSGEFVVVWASSDAFHITVQKFNADGTTTNYTPVKLEAFGISYIDNAEPQLTAVGNAGEFLVTWHGQDSDGNYRVFVQKFNADGTTAHDTPVLLAAGGNFSGRGIYPQITALGSDGEFVVAWQGVEIDGDNSIFVQKFNADGTANGNALVNISDAVDYSLIPQLTEVGSGGEFVVAWFGGNSYWDGSIFVQKFNADGTISGNTVQLDAGGRAGSANFFPQIAALGDSGEFVVIWAGENSDNSIFVQKFNADGTITDQSMVQLEAIGNSGGQDQAPQVTALGNSGEFVVTWQGQDSGYYSDHSIFVLKFNADGTTTNQTRVMLEAVGNAYGYDGSPQITALGASGEYVVTWFGYESDSWDTSIFVQKFNADGTTSHQHPIKLEAIGNASGNDSFPQITALGSSGEFVVTWTGVDSDGETSV